MSSNDQKPSNAPASQSAVKSGQVAAQRPSEEVAVAAAAVSKRDAPVSELAAKAGQDDQLEVPALVAGSAVSSAGAPAPGPLGMPSSATSSTKPVANLFDLVELREPILALVAVDRSFDPALLRVCRSWHDYFLPRLYTEVDLTGPKSRCVKFIKGCDLGRLERLGIRIKGLAVSGDYDPEPKERGVSRPKKSSTTLGRLYEKFKTTPTATASVTTLRVVSGRSFPRHESFIEVHQLELDVTVLAGLCARLATLVLDKYVGKVIAVEDTLEGVPNLNAPRPWAKVTLEVPFKSFLRRSKIVGVLNDDEEISLYFKAVRPTFEDPDDRLWFAPEEVLGRLQNVVRGLAVAGLNIGALEFGSSFESYLSGGRTRYLDKPKWAVVERFAQEHRHDLPFVVTFPADLRLADAFDQAELAWYDGLDAMVEDMILTQKDSEADEVGEWDFDGMSSDGRESLIEKYGPDVLELFEPHGEFGHVVIF